MDPHLMFKFLDRINQSSLKLRRGRQDFFYISSFLLARHSKPLRREGGMKPKKYNPLSAELQ
jgi:hypothetical protein